MSTRGPHNARLRDFCRSYNPLPIYRGRGIVQFETFEHQQDVGPRWSVLNDRNNEPGWCADCLRVHTHDTEHHLCRLCFQLQDPDPKDGRETYYGIGETSYQEGRQCGCMMHLCPSCPSRVPIDKPHNAANHIVFHALEQYMFRYFRLILSGTVEPSRPIFVREDAWPYLERNQRSKVLFDELQTKFQRQNPHVFFHERLSCCPVSWADHWRMYYPLVAKRACPIERLFVACVGKQPTPLQRMAAHPLYEKRVWRIICRFLH